MRRVGAVALLTPIRRSPASASPTSPRRAVVAGSSPRPPWAAVSAPLVLAACLLLAGGCASGGADGRPGDADAGTEVGAEAADSAAAVRAEDDAARRAASEHLVARGRALLEEGRAGEAAGVLERAVRRDPSNGHAYLALARARVSLGEEAAAVGLLERAGALLREDHPRAAAQADSLRATLEVPEGR